MLIFFLRSSNHIDIGVISIIYQWLVFTRITLTVMLLNLLDGTVSTIWQQACTSHGILHPALLAHTK